MSANRLDELCASCGMTFAGHIGNTGCVFPCWTPSGRFAPAPVPAAPVQCDAEKISALGLGKPAEAPMYSDQLLAALKSAAPAPEATSRKPFCHSGADGDCDWPECPQNRDGEPDATGRDCPLFAWDDDDAGRSMILAAATEPAAPEATREADPRLAARCPSFALGGQGRRIHCSRLLGHKGSHSFMPGYVPGEESEDQPYYSQTVVDELLVAERAAQARENETMRADNQRLALRVKTLLDARATAARKQEALKAELEALPRWGMVSRGGEAPELDHSPRGGFVERSAVLRALAARAPER